MKKNVLIVGAGGVATVVAHKCAEYSDILGRISIASRDPSKAQRIIENVKSRYEIDGNMISAHQLDALDIEATKSLIESTRSKIVINVGSSFINMSVLRACIDCDVAYIDTAIHEDPDKVCEPPPWYANHEWKFEGECDAKHITAILGIGFDPGVVNAYTALASSDYLDNIESIDIFDVNAGVHGKYFSTNFDPEINFREFTGTVWSWQNAQWVSNSMFEIKRIEDLPVVGKQTLYLTGHDEIHSLSVKMKIDNIRFWMSFGDHYRNVFEVLNNLGLLSSNPVRTREGDVVVPLKVVKAVLPDPSSLAQDYRGKTCIGVLAKGDKTDIHDEVFIYNICDHEDCFSEVGSQAISYTAGLPPVAAAILISTGEWDIGRMVNVEDLNPHQFLHVLDRLGLQTRIRHGSRDFPFTAPFDGEFDIKSRMSRKIQPV